jgi:nitrite reductase/ring-hydroxylating ferredoxin subunit
MGYTIVLGAAYLGGDLVYRQRIGVTHAADALPEEFIPVLDSAALPENARVRARVADTDVLLVRQHGRVCALVHTCAHLGGPLSEGLERWVCGLSVAWIRVRRGRRSRPEWPLGA